jgi:predicted nucleotidyltransferase component of viral defense system
MDTVTRLSQQERSELFSETAAQMGMTPAVAEKDFWVTWTLGKIFTHPTLQSILRFKGGTSLSKVYHLIERFSEDIDLILNWNELPTEDPEQERSKTRQQKFNEAIHKAEINYIAEHLLPVLSDTLGPVCWCDIDPERPYVVNILYPNAFPSGYLRPEICLEIGALASWLPSETHTIAPYAAECFPEVFTEPSCPVHVIAAERTFWEKVIILHHEAHRPEGSHQPAGLSRHYYDVARMASQDVKDRALADLAMLERVVAFKMKFYPRGWARYELAKPGTLRLVPQGHVLESVKNDYTAMREMIYGDYPDYEEIHRDLQDLENEINTLV